MRPTAKRNTSNSIAVQDSVEVRFRAKGAQHAYRLAIVLAGKDAVNRAQTMSLEFAATYGDLEFAIFKNGSLLAQVERPAESVPHGLKYAL